MGERADDEAETRTDGSAAMTDDPAVEAAQSPQPPTYAPPGSGSFGWRGWILVGMIAFSFLVIPWTLVYLPAAQSQLATIGLSLRDAYLALPMIPAILLAIVAVWAAVRSRAR